MFAVWGKPRPHSGGHYCVRDAFRWRPTTQVTDVGTEHRWVAPLRNTAGRCAPELNVLVVRGRDISARPMTTFSMPLTNTAAFRESDREGRYARVGLGAGRAGLAHLFFKIHVVLHEWLKCGTVIDWSALWSIRHSGILRNAQHSQIHQRPTVALLTHGLSCRMPSPTAGLRARLFIRRPSALVPVPYKPQ
jgi:hypothetical protein